MFGDVSGTPIPHEVLEDFLFSPDESLDVEMGPELPQAQPLALENGVSEPKRHRLFSECSENIPRRVAENVLESGR